MIYISELLPKSVSDFFENAGFRVRLVRAGEACGAVATHPDIYMCAVGGRLITAERGEVSGGYPHNASFCALAIEKYFVHNLKITSPRLLSAAEAAGLTPVHVRQGYAKCSCASPDGRSVITSDEGIARALEKQAGVDVLLISPGHILLPGHEYGFIGGASGRVGDTLFFLGNVAEHPDYERIRAFSEAHGAAVTGFPFPLTDAGGIIEAAE